MRIRTVTTSLIGLALVLALAAPAAAQGAVAGDAPELGVGVSFFRIFEQTGTGFFVDVAKPIKPMNQGSLGIVGDFGYHAFDGGKVMTFMGGARFKSTANAKFSPFGQFLIGMARDSADDCDGEGCSSTNLSFAPGGGVNVAINDKFSFRAQIDFIMIRFSEGDFSDTESGPRFSFGISMPIGR